MRMKKKYIAPQTEMSEVELESGFMKGSIVDQDALDQATISIEEQEVGAESDYFNNHSTWDY